MDFVPVEGPARLTANAVGRLGKGKMQSETGMPSSQLPAQLRTTLLARGTQTAKFHG
jgi:hypothetical protein